MSFKAHSVIVFCFYLVITSNWSLAQVFVIDVNATALSQEGISANHTLVNDETTTLKHKSGLDFVDGGSAMSQIFIQGSPSTHTMIIIDGIVQNPSGEAFDFSRLSGSQIKQVKILKGDHSTQFGLGAAGGVVNITTINKGSLCKHTATAAIGGMHSQKLNTHICKSFSTMRFNFVGNILNDNGYKVSPEKHATTKPKTAHDYAIQSSYDSESSQLNLQFEQKRQKEYLMAGAYKDANNNQSFLTQNSAKLGYFTALSEYQTLDFEVSHTILNRRFYHPLSEDNDFLINYQDEEENTLIDAKSSWFYEQATLNTGLLVKDSKYNSIDKTTDEKGKFSRENEEIFLHLSNQLTQQLKVSGGARWVPKEESLPRFFGFSWNPEQSIEFGGKISVGATQPTLFQKFSPKYGNTQLSTESTDYYGIYIEKKNETYYHRSDLYFKKIDQLIDYDTITEKYLNIRGNNKIKGIDIDNKLYLEPFHFGLQLSYLTAVNQNNQEMPRRANFKANIYGEKASGTSKYRLSIFYKGARKDSIGAKKHLSPYSLIDLSMERPLTRSLSLGLLVNNLLNRRYEDVAGYLGRPRNIWLNLNWSA